MSYSMFSVVRHYNILSICNTDSKLRNYFLPGPSLILLQIEPEFRPSLWSPLNTGGNSLKTMWGMGEMLCLLLLSHLLPKVPKEWADSNGRDQSSFGINGKASSCMVCRVRFLNWPCAGRGGTHDCVFLGIVELPDLTCSAASVVRPNSPYSCTIQKRFVEYLLCVRACASAKDSQMKSQFLPWKTSQSSIRVKQGNKPPYSVFP